MQSQKNFNRINETIQTALKNLSEIIDVNTVVGSPINTDNGQVIIPISKVTVGVLAGGGEYGKISIFKKNDDLPFSAGNGAIVSLKPCGFLVKEQDKYRLICVSNNVYEKFIDKATDIISDIKTDIKNEKNQ